MTKKLLCLFAIGLLFQSCGFVFYSYRGYYDSDFSIPNNNADTSIRYSAGQLIYRLSYKSDLYNRWASSTYDTLSFYGPDYHTLKFKITETAKSTNIHFNYFGYNGWRGNPPHKLFINTLRDSLKNKYGATEIINKDTSNEKKKKNGT